MTDNETQPTPPANEGIRINKYLASCGYESRRKADALIAEGAVEINGKRVEAPGARVMPGDYVKVNGKHAQPKDGITILLNKPRGYVCSRDPQGAEGTVFDLLPSKYRYVNYVGRLDADSEGLLILTNKGEYNQRLGHPTGGVEKEYWVTLDQPYENSVLLQLLKGVRIAEGQAKAKYICRLSPRRACVVLEQGLRRQVRQMFSCLGFRVRKLVRVRIGSLWGGDLAPGRAMLLTPEQEKLAATNPAPRKGMISAAQAFPIGGALSAEQLERALDEKAARKALEEETDYVFNPADFETEEEAQGHHPASPRRERGARYDGAGRHGGDRGPRRRHDDERPRRFGEERRPYTHARSGGKKWGDAPRRRFDDAAPRRYREEGEPRPHGGFRKQGAPHRRENTERGPRRFDDAQPRRFGRDGGGERRFRNDGGRRYSAPGERRGGFGRPHRDAGPGRGGKRY